MPTAANKKTGIFWFRDDLRLDDNPGLKAAAEESEALLLLYILEPEQEAYRPPASAARWWLHHSLKALMAELRTKGQELILVRGKAKEMLVDIAEKAGASTVYWNRRFGPGEELDKAVRSELEANGVGTEVRSASLLFEPEALLEGRDGPFKVYSAFWKSALRRFKPRLPVPEPDVLPPPPPNSPAGETLDDLKLTPRNPDWSGGLDRNWTPGSKGADAALETFIDDGLADYKRQRDVPSVKGTSRLSPHLRFGEISPARVWDRLERSTLDAGKFRAELGWREFAYHTLSAFPHVATENLREPFDDFPWRNPAKNELEAWQRGQTGIPIVDAGMRELWETGWMHNRVRMIVASLLTKNLLIDWRVGEAWFWDTLVDADPANNPFGWQWVAGSGFDAQPFFRIFNPILQGERFDPEGDYVRRWVPEIAELPDHLIHKPWQATPMELAESGVRLGETYPEPIVDLKETRKRALAAYDAIK